MSASQQYDKKTHLEHILLRPDTYIGSIQKETQEHWIVKFDEKAMGRNPIFMRKQIEWYPGLYKLFDEILVNATDNRQRDPDMKYLKVDFTETSISVYNTGKGIPIEMHEKHNVYIPELIFGHLLTGSNYDDKQKRTTGGRNGYGAKLTNIYSQKFILETCDGLYKYKQVWEKNMTQCKPPKITKCKQKSYTRVTFYPDFKLFDKDKISFSEDEIALYTRRVYDITGLFSGLYVYIQGERIRKSYKSKHNFLKYVEDYESTFSNTDEKFKPIYEKQGNFEYCVTLSKNGKGFQVSFVNGIHTSEGGTHVNYLYKLIHKKLTSQKKGKYEITVDRLKRMINLYVNCFIVNPKFGNQVKTKCITSYKEFQDHPISDIFVKKLLKTDITNYIEDLMTVKELKDHKKNDGKKRSRLSGIPKLDDANKAGTKQSHKCTLYLTEGDSAKTFVVSGFSIIGRDYNGVFPLKGKLLNVLQSNEKDVNKNQEITFLKQIIGLQLEKDYTSSISSLRYGRIVICTDQDHDGSHIRGLILAFFSKYWPSLLRRKGFMNFFCTPILKVFIGKKEHIFFHEQDYEEWSRNKAKNYKTKYYKGLGTSTSKEAKSYFRDIHKHLIPFHPALKDDDDSIKLAFDKGADKRRSWLAEQTGTKLHYGKGISIKTFVHKELKLFSLANNIRAIPNLYDGLKPSQRKILFTFLEKNIKEEVKLSEVTGTIMKYSKYHHGEKSIYDALIRMAQNYSGSNNIAFLQPKGQFGTRILLGKDHSSPRYIFTKIHPIVRSLFNAEDTPLLKYERVDNDTAEPTFYLPILPTVLINGTEGIGTGWRTKIPSYSPNDILLNMRRYLKGHQMLSMKPYWLFYNGEIKREQNGKFCIKGTFIETVDGYIVTEIPIQTSITAYKQFLERLELKNMILKFEDQSTEFLPRFKIVVNDEQRVILSKNIYKNLQLEKEYQKPLFVLFDHEQRLKQYSSELDILLDFMEFRKQKFQDRLDYQISSLEKDLSYLQAKEYWIDYIMENGFQLFQNGDEELISFLTSQSVPKQDSNYHYLIHMPVNQFTQKKRNQLKKERENKKILLEQLKLTTVNQLWLDLLNKFEAEWNKYVGSLRIERNDDKKILNIPKRLKR